MISFIISTYNGLELTKACLASLQQTVTRSDYEVILVDYLSTDGTREFLATLAPPVRVILNATRHNYAAVARGEILDLLNNDFVLTPGWLDPMLAAFDRQTLYFFSLSNLAAP